MSRFYIYIYIIKYYILYTHTYIYIFYLSIYMHAMEHRVRGIEVAQTKNSEQVSPMAIFERTLKF